MAVWGTVEITCGFLAVCLPVLPRLWNHFKRTRFASRLRSSLPFAPAKLRPPECQHERDMSGAHRPGSGTGAKSKPDARISDAEFYDLMKRSENSDVSTVNVDRNDDIVSRGTSDDGLV